MSNAETFPPRHVEGTSLRAISVTGHLSPFYADGQPLLGAMTACSDLFLLLFEGEEELERFKADFPEMGFDKVVLVEDGMEFLGSIPPHIRIAVNLRKEGPESRCRYTEVFRP